MPIQRPYAATALMCALASAGLTLVLSVVSARSGASASDVALGAAVWFAAVYALVFVLAVIALRTVGISGGTANVDASGVLVFVGVFAVAFVAVTAADFSSGALLAFSGAIAASAVWRAVRD
jgi:hypothetical protein